MKYETNARRRGWMNDGEFAQNYAKKNDGEGGEGWIMNKKTMD